MPSRFVPQIQKKSRFVPDVKEIAKEAIGRTLFPFMPRPERVIKEPFKVAEELTYGFRAVAAARGLEKIGVLPKIKELTLKGRKVMPPTPPSLLGLPSTIAQEAYRRAPEDVAKIATEIGVDVGTIIGLDKLFQKGIGLIPRAKQLLKESLGKTTAEEVAQRVQSEKSIIGAIRKLKPDMRKKVIQVLRAERAVTEPEALAKAAQAKPTLVPEAAPPAVKPPITPKVKTPIVTPKIERATVIKDGQKAVVEYNYATQKLSDINRKIVKDMSIEEYEQIKKSTIERVKKTGAKLTFKQVGKPPITPEVRPPIPTGEGGKIRLQKAREEDVFTRPEFFDKGTPGFSNTIESFSEERPLLAANKFRKSVVFRDKNGEPQGVLSFDITESGKLDIDRTFTELGAKFEKAIQPPTAPPKAPVPPTPEVEEAFLKQPKPKTSIIQYFKPAEYHLKELGFEEKIAQPVREAMQDFTIELQDKSKFVNDIEKLHQRSIPLGQKKTSDLKLWNYMDKGITKEDISIEAQIARKYRPETEEMLRRLNEVRLETGKDEIKGVKNYILHSLKPEILNEIYAKGVIPSELAKVMEYIPPKNLFLRTAEQRKGVPEEWLVKNPHKLMRMMYAIDLKYIHLQRALAKIDPYLKAVKEYKDITPQGKIDEWTPETYKYLDDWIKQAIKMRPSNWDTLIDNMAEYTLAPMLRKVGLKVSHMPWRDFVSTLSAAAHTGALGMRIRPILRNLVQSTFDWVMYGTQPYFKGANAFLTKEGRAILQKSKVWRTRIPYEAQDIATLQKMFKIGGLGYRASDLHNVGKGLLTRYYHAIDNLKMSPDKALKWADQDLPATQWSYRREDLPRAYWTTTGRAFWTLGSWWMNFYTRFLPELLRRAFTGKDVLGRVVPTSERLGVMRLLILAGTLYAVKEHSKEITGTVVDYTGQVLPTPLRQAPIAQMGINLVNLAQGLTEKNDRKVKESLRNLSRTSKIFIPWWLAGQDLFRYISGERTLGETLFYGKQPKKRKSKFVPSRTTKTKSRFMK